MRYAMSRENYNTLVSTGSVTIGSVTVTYNPIKDDYFIPPDLSDFGVTVGPDVINLLTGVTSNVQTQLDGKQSTLAAQTAYSAKGAATKVPQITTNALGQVTGITEVTISGVTPAPHTHTKSEVGLGNVDNTGDSSIPVENGTTKFTTGGAYTLQNEVKNYAKTINKIVFLG